jgi:hypothetical protein
VGVHRAGSWWLRQSSDAEAAPRWKARWSLAITATVGLLFVAGIAVIGITHQTAWLATAPEPLRYETVKSWGQPSSEYVLKNLGVGVGTYRDCYTCYPPGGTFTPEGEMLHSWVTYILPFAVPNYSTQEIDWHKPWNHPRNAKYFRCVLPPVINPELPAPLADQEGFGFSHYAANSRVMGPNPRFQMNSYTIIIGEVNADFKPWGHPGNWRDPALGLNTSSRGFGGRPGAGGVLFATSGGSVQFVSDRVSPEVLERMAQPQNAREDPNKGAVFP